LAQDSTQDVKPFVSVILPVRNEAAWIARSLGAVLAQDYPADRMEILLVDGGSEDDTLGTVRSLSGAERVRILANPRRNQAAAMNIGIGAARGDIIVRVDGHTVIAPDYIGACVATLAATGAANVGGRMDPVMDSVTDPALDARGLAPATEWAQAIALATTSAFAAPAAFHTSRTARFTDTVYMGAWPRAVFERVGLFDEALPPNEDYELNYRIRRSGGTIYLSPAIRSTYFARQTLGALARQYFLYGRGKARMLARHPAAVRPRQFVAPAFVAALALGPLVAWRSSAMRFLWLLMVGTYAALNLGVSGRRTRCLSAASAKGQRGWEVRWLRWRLPVVFLTLHLTWGAGFWVGLLGLLRPHAGATGRRRFYQRPRRRDPHAVECVAHGRAHGARLSAGALAARRER
jgi:glycosyltransferase involved in cell wall biosynthesis